MRVLLINGSQTKQRRNTEYMTELFIQEAKGKLDVDVVTLHNLKFTGCNECLGCVTAKKCVREDDISEVLDRLYTYDALIFVFPIFNFGIPSLTQMFMERMYAYFTLQMPIGAIIVHGSAYAFESGLDLVDETLCRYCHYTHRPYLGMVHKVTHDEIKPVTDKDRQNVTELIKEVLYYG